MPEQKRGHIHPAHAPGRGRELGHLAGGDRSREALAPVADPSVPSEASVDEAPAALQWWARRSAGPRPSVGDPPAHVPDGCLWIVLEVSRVALCVFLWIFDALRKSGAGPLIACPGVP